MTVSEEEAKSKMCCNMPTTCYGSQCMAWLWADIEVEPRRADQAAMSSNIALIKIFFTEKSTTHGYCGLVK